MNDTVKVLAISGSLRKDSYNTMLLKAAAEMAPEGMEIGIFDIAPIPLYNHDIQDEGFPGSVNDFTERIAASDALLIASPEYNYSIPGVLKNAIDWASRKPGLFAGKAAAIMGATTGNWGTVKMQMHLRHVFVFLDVHPLNKPEVLVARAQDKFSPEGKLTDEMTQKVVAAQLAALLDWTRLIRKNRG